VKIFDRLEVLLLKLRDHRGQELRARSWQQLRAQGLHLGLLLDDRSACGRDD